MEAYEGRKRIPTIYSEALKALYWTVDAAKLFYDNLCNFLNNKLQFRQNPYDQCVMNKSINGKQATIAFHVDDLKISLHDPELVTSIINSLSNKYGNIMPLSISRGKVYDYLGMVFDYTNKGQVKINMYQYINGLLEHAPEIYNKGAGKAKPAPEHRMG